MKRKILIVSFFVCSMLLIPVTPVMSESEINEDIEIESPSEKANSGIYRFCIYIIVIGEEGHGEYVEITRNGIGFDISFKLDMVGIRIISLVPLKHQNYDADTLSGRVENFIGVPIKLGSHEPAYLYSHCFFGFAHLVEIY